MNIKNLIKNKLTIFLAFLLFSPLHAYSQDKPIYGKGCGAKDLKEANRQLDLLFTTYVGSKGMEKCGWNLNRKSIGTLELLLIADTKSCWGEQVAIKKMNAYEKNASSMVTATSCNDERMQFYKSEYIKLINLISD